MKAFAELLERLVFTPSRNGKLLILERYLRDVPDPDRGLGLAALTDALSFRHAKPALIRELVSQRVDPSLFALSYDFVGDLAETTALIWPDKPEGHIPPRLGEVVEQLSVAGKLEMPQKIAGWLDQLDPSGRIALLKLITGGLRVGVSARLAKTALARFGEVPLAEIEELWHGLTPPYGELFAWLEGHAPRPTVDEAATFKPLMLANPLDENDIDRLSAADYLAEWKWDGIRVQVVAGRDSRRLYSRTGDDIGASFPDILEQLEFSAVLDGELLVLREGTVAPFNDLQQRLGRKSVGRKMLGNYPAHIRLYDLLFEDGTDLRELSFVERRRRLEGWCASQAPGRMDLSPLVPFDRWDELAALRAGARQAGIEGLMLKHRDSPYQGGRPKGPWFKWKRDPLVADCVLMYAQRGHGKRSSYYSDYTFGCWRPGPEGGDELVPVGKAYFGFTDAELLEIDRWVRGHTLESYGPVRAVEAGLVFEVAFDAVQASKRHKSGLAMRFPRISRIRWDKPADEADRLDTLVALID